jgi:hypothetical protein
MQIPHLERRFESNTVPAPIFPLSFTITSVAQPKPPGLSRQCHTIELFAGGRWGPWCRNHIQDLNGMRNRTNLPFHRDRQVSAGAVTGFALPRQCCVGVGARKRRIVYAALVINAFSI